eukprot:CAMPEP_0170058416 /NCGR_PEP_ID=MMETSP0019_2-20121128/1048_1 /TAXON_ID=98059 /ORGANISM="Dinobryon sp., Strain UTEXLB2267" /LENGTH=98 /DNA_ID=CAMNT_0010263353 /DNA_START=375 /DNA_END=671 /DNA_ORIENTATION=-
MTPGAYVGVGSQADPLAIEAVRSLGAGIEDALGKPHVNEVGHHLAASSLSLLGQFGRGNGVGLQQLHEVDGVRGHCEDAASEFSELPADEYLCHQADH